jgi:hypothetical protein
MENPRHEAGTTLARLAADTGRICYNLPPWNDVLIYRRLFVGIERPHLHPLPKGEYDEADQDKACA